MKQSLASQAFGIPGLCSLLTQELAHSALGKACGTQLNSLLLCIPHLNLSSHLGPHPSLQCGHELQPTSETSKEEEKAEAAPASDTAGRTCVDRAPGLSGPFSLLLFSPTVPSSSSAFATFSHFFASSQLYSTPSRAPRGPPTPMARTPRSRGGQGFPPLPLHLPLLVWGRGNEMLKPQLRTSLKSPVHSGNGLSPKSPQAGSLGHLFLGHSLLLISS